MAITGPLLALGMFLLAGGTCSWRADAHVEFESVAECGAAAVQTPRAQ
jgi:hypothetical protein